MFCFKCGEKLPADAQFCYNCGSTQNLDQPQVQAEVQPQIEIQPQTQVNPQIQAQPQPQINPQQATQSAVAPNNNKIFIGIILALCVCILVMFVSGNSSDKDSSKVDTNKVDTNVVLQDTATSNASLNNEANEAYAEYLDYLRENYANDNFDLYGFPGVLGLYSSNRSIDDLTYAILDIDKDGIDELLIGRTGDNDPGYLHGFFAFIDGEVISIESSQDGFYLYLMNDFSFYWRYKSIGITKHKFENNEFIQLEYYKFERVDEGNSNEYSWFEVLKTDGKYDNDNLRQFTQEDRDLFEILDNEQYEINYIPLNSSSNDNVGSNTNNNVTTLDLNSIIDFDSLVLNGQAFTGTGKFGIDGDYMERPDPSNPTAGRAYETINQSLANLDYFYGKDFFYWVVGDDLFLSFSNCIYAFKVTTSTVNINKGDALFLYENDLVLDVVARTEDAQSRLEGYKNTTNLLSRVDCRDMIESWCYSQPDKFIYEIYYSYPIDNQVNGVYIPNYFMKIYFCIDDREISGAFYVYFDLISGDISVEINDSLYPIDDWYNIFIR